MYESFPLPPEGPHIFCSCRHFSSPSSSWRIYSLCLPHLQFISLQCWGLRNAARKFKLETWPAEIAKEAFLSYVIPICCRLYKVRMNLCSLSRSLALALWLSGSNSLMNPHKFSESLRIIFILTLTFKRFHCKELCCPLVVAILELT